MFQDEARFGRISELRDCWAPKGIRPKVPKQHVREAVYSYVAVAPAEGELVRMIKPKVNAVEMGVFLRYTAMKMKGKRIIMVLDGAGWHRAKALKIPASIRLLRLPPYSPELNPVEHVWDEVREKGFANQLFLDLASVESRIKTTLDDFAKNPGDVRSMTYFPWVQLLCV